MKTLLILFLTVLALPAAECRLTLTRNGDVSFPTEKGKFYKLFWTHDLTNPKWFSSFQYEAIGEDRVLTVTNIWRGSIAFYRMHITPVRGDEKPSTLTPATLSITVPLLSRMAPTMTERRIHSPAHLAGEL